MSLTLAAIGGVVTAAVKYLIASKGAELAAGKAAEKMGEMGGETLFTLGKNAFTRIQAVLGRRGPEADKANRALANVEAEPEEQAYQHKLATELEKLATSDSELRRLLEELSADVKRAGGGGDVQGSVNVYDNAQVDQAAGVNTGTMTYNARIRDDDD